MKRFISILLCATILLWMSIGGATTEPIIITPEVFTARFNQFMKAYFEASGMTPIPVELSLGDADPEGFVPFSLNIENGFIKGKARDGIVEEVDLSVDDPMGYVMLLAGTIAVSDIPNPVDGMDIAVMEQHIIGDPNDDDVSFTNGYRVETTERYEGTIGTRLSITIDQ